MSLIEAHVPAVALQNNSILFLNSLNAINFVSVGWLLASYFAVSTSRNDCFKNPQNYEMLWRNKHGVNNFKSLWRLVLVICGERPESATFMLKQQNDILVGGGCKNHGL